MYDALKQPGPTLLHLSFHTWMLSDRDLERFDGFLRRYANHPEVSFTTPQRLALPPREVARCLSLRRSVQVLKHTVARRVWLWEHDDPFEFYLLEPRYYQRKLCFLVPAAVICRGLGITGGLLASTIAAVVLTVALVETWRDPTGHVGLDVTLRVVLGALLIGALLMLRRSLQLLQMRRRQQRAEVGAGIMTTSEAQT